SKGMLNCAAARDWCAEGRSMFTNTSAVNPDPSTLLVPLPGYEHMPARFEMANVRYSQYSPNAAIYHNNAAINSGFRFGDDGSNVSGTAYPYGFRGGLSGFNGAMGTSMNGDGPLVSSQQVLRPPSERRTGCTSSEYNVTARPAAYVSGDC